MERNVWLLIFMRNSLRRACWYAVKNAFDRNVEPFTISWAIILDAIIYHPYESNISKLFERKQEGLLNQSLIVILFINYRQIKGSYFWITDITYCFAESSLQSPPSLMPLKSIVQVLTYIYRQQHINYEPLATASLLYRAKSLLSARNNWSFCSIGLEGNLITIPNVFYQGFVSKFL